MAREVSNSEDILDSRDIIQAFEDLENAAVFEAEQKLGTEELPVDFDPTEYLDDDEAEQYRALKALIEEAKDSPDWKYGATLIRDSYFEDYAQQLAEDIGAVSRDFQWPLGCIDWKQAAEELQMDYFSVDYAGVTYWVHA